MAEDGQKMVCQPCGWCDGRKRRRAEDGMPAAYKEKANSPGPLDSRCHFVKTNEFDAHISR